MIRDRLLSVRDVFSGAPELARAALASLLAGALAAGCGPDAPSLVLAVEELPTPAGVGSGEPSLSSSDDTVYMSWLEPAGSGAHALRFARFLSGEWSAPTLIAAGDRMFANWADVPSLSPGTDGSLWAHWLERGSGNGYGIRITHSADGGASWSDPWTPHEDGTPTDHGFVSTVSIGGDLGLLWLDGRRSAAGSNAPSVGPEMALFFRMASGGKAAGPEVLVDSRVCDCCRTDVASSDAGPVAVYRDRSPDEIRDIRIIRLRDGAWDDGEIVNEDGWETAACPVNGPAVAARGGDVAVAWFTAARGVPRVKVAFSGDGGGSFGDPVVVDDGNPAGRVDVLLIDGGTALVSWLERTGGEWAEVRVRLVATGARRGESVSVSTSEGERAGGFPQLAAAAPGSVLVAWTDVSELAPRVRVARIDVELGTRTTEGT